MSETEPERPSPAPEAPSDLATAPIRAGGDPDQAVPPVAAGRGPGAGAVAALGAVGPDHRRGGRAAQAQAPRMTGAGPAGTADGRGQSSGSAATNGS